MENYPATLTIYVPEMMGDDRRLLREVLEPLRKRFGGEVRARLDNVTDYGGTIVIRDCDAAYGRPHDVDPGELPPGIDYDMWAEAENGGERETYVLWSRAGQQIDRNTTTYGEPLLSRRQLEKAIAELNGRNPLSLLALYDTPPPTYPVPSRRFETEEDGAMLDEEEQSTDSPATNTKGPT